MITIHFIANNDPKALGSATISSKTGRSLMQAAQSGGVDGIAADCGGSLTCATCHVHGARTLGQPVAAARRG